MEQRFFDRNRELMVSIIEIYAYFASRRTGRASLDPRVLSAMARVPRHAFVPHAVQRWSYSDMSLPIGCGMAIPQPFIIALMTDLLDLADHDHVLEIGTGRGYQAAVLAALVDRVHSIEIISALAREADHRLRGLGYRNIDLRCGDGNRGWPEHAPFDRIIVTAAVETVPRKLLGQLKPGGKMVLPLGPPNQQKLAVVEKLDRHRTGIREVLSVRFQPLIACH